MKLRILSESDVRRCLDMRDAVDAQAQAFALLAARQTVEGLRSFVTSETPPAVTIFNPSYLKNAGGFGIKVVSDFLENDDRTVPRMSALVVLFCGRTGVPRTVMEGGYLTDVRTGAGTALAARHLARAESSSLVLFGAGRVARNQLVALAATLPLARVRVVARSRPRADAFVRWARGQGGDIPRDVELAADADAAVAEADIVVCATTATQPVLHGAALRPGTFVAAVGANRADAREVDSETISRAGKRVIDSRADCLEHAGDLQIPLREGVLRAGEVAEIAEVVAGQRGGRESADEITYYKSIGVPIQDIWTAQRIEARAIEAQIGTVLDIGGDPIQMFEIAQTMTQINPDRLLSTLETLRNFGRDGTGVHRPALTPADLDARLWLRQQLAGIGYDASIDRFGTVWGRAPGDAPVILIGSHTDTVPHGGWLDGALGVAYALEIATARVEALGANAARVEVVSFQDEEGTFVPFLGSLGFIGEITDPAPLAEKQAPDGRRLGDALAAAAIREQPIARLDARRTLAFLEAHIEQGPRLEAKGLPIGVVTAIVGIRRFRVVVEGRADHAGTTPLDLRQDAGAAALRLAVAVLDSLQAARGPDTVWNIGHVAFQPGAANVVPAVAAFMLEFRDVQEKLLDQLEAQVRALAAAHSRASGLPISVEPTALIPATPLTASIADAFEAAAQDLGLGAMRLSSGAGHDAMVLARRIPAGMLFVPSIAGRSHDVSEDTSAADIVAGAQVMARAVDRLLGTA